MKRSTNDNGSGGNHSVQKAPSESSPTCCRFYVCVSVLVSACCACISVSVSMCVCVCLFQLLSLTRVTLSHAQIIPNSLRLDGAQWAQIIARKAQFAWNCSDWPLRFCVPTFAVCQQLCICCWLVSNTYFYFLRVNKQNKKKNIE